jgi:hypothetical protein
MLAIDRVSESVTSSGVVAFASNAVAPPPPPTSPRLFADDERNGVAAGDSVVGVFGVLAGRRAGVDDASSCGALGLVLIGVGVVNIPSASAAAASSASSAEGRGSARSDVGVELKGVRWSRKASMAGNDSEG